MNYTLQSIEVLLIKTMNAKNKDCHLEFRDYDCYGYITTYILIPEIGRWYRRIMDNTRFRIGNLYDQLD